MQQIDFTGCPRVLGKAYNGANGKKIAVSYAGETWILKFPPDAKQRPNEQFYTNSCISEYLGSTIFRLLGVDAQETLLGIHVNGKTKVVCACKDFTSPGVRLYDDKPRELTTAIDHLAPRIHALDLESLILPIPYISSLQKEFYIKYLNARRTLLF